MEHYIAKWYWEIKTPKKIRFLESHDTVQHQASLPPKDLSIPGVAAEKRKAEKALGKAKAKSKAKAKAVAPVETAPEEPDEWADEWPAEDNHDDHDMDVDMDAEGTY